MGGTEPRKLCFNQENYASVRWLQSGAQTHKSLRPAHPVLLNRIISIISIDDIVYVDNRYRLSR